MNQNIKRRVKEAAIDKFIKFGYRKVTTDEIAKEAGISKRTLYENFDSKEDIVKSIVLDELQSIKDRIESICNDNKLTIIEKFITLFNVPRKISDRSNFELFKDFKNEIPEIIKIMNEYETIINKMLIELFNKGQKAGYIRKDIDPLIIFKMGRVFKDKLTDEDLQVLGNISKFDLFKIFRKLFVQGILSRKAILEHYDEIESLLEEYN